jgi:hydrogenase expression/formation protein HypC
VRLLPGSSDQLALVDVVGTEQKVNIGMLEDSKVEVGDYILIHMGFAMSKVSKQEAEEALSMLEMLGDTPTDNEQAPLGWGNR